MSKSNAAKKIVPEVTAVVAPVAKAKVGFTVTATQQKQLDSYTTKSDKIRYLAAEKYTTSQIKDILGIRYQHVRNVLITPVKNPGGARNKVAGQVTAKA